jgi:drug/metabolite transporter (DMT)-like permease
MRDCLLYPGLSMREQVNSFKIMGAFLAVYVVWGSTYLGIRYAIETLPPLLMMGLRHVAAGALLYGWLRLRGGRAPERRLWVPAAIAGGLCFLLGHGILAWAEQRVSSGMAALLIATEPLIMVVLAHVAGQERLSMRTFAGLAIGLGGIALLFDAGAKQGGILAASGVLVSSAMWSAGAIYARAYTRSSAALFAAMQMLSGGALLLIAGAAAGERLHLASVSPRSWAALLYLIVFGSIVAFGAYTWLMRASTAAKVSTHAYVNPIVAVWLGWAVAGEVVTRTMILGTVIVLASVALVTMKRSERVALAKQRMQTAAD